MSTFKTQEVKRIVDVIYKAIIEQRLPAGTRLIEIKLAEALKANRNHIRSALQELQTRRVVLIETNKGACVASPSRAEASEVFEARRVLECALVLQAISKATSKDLADLRKLISQEIDAIEKGLRPDIVRLSGEFHLAIAQIANNSVMIGMLDHLIAASSLIVGLYEPTHDAACSSSDHLKLVDLMSNEDKEGAVAFLDEHLAAVEERLVYPEEEEQELDFTTLLAS